LPPSLVLQIPRQLRLVKHALRFTWRASCCHPHARRPQMPKLLLPDLCVLVFHHALSHSSNLHIITHLAWLDVNLAAAATCAWCPYAAGGACARLVMSICTEPCSRMSVQCKHSSNGMTCMQCELHSPRINSCNHSNSHHSSDATSKLHISATMPLCH
jgi:hypothetical protein